MVNTIKNTLKPIVIGPGRGGFTLCISVLVHLLKYFPDKRNYKQKLLDHVVRELGNYFAIEMRNTFAKAGIHDELIFNGNFDYLPGGPKWIDETGKFGVSRKYIGVKGLGDFTLLLKFPKEVLDIDDVLHSHVNPKKWLNDPDYHDYLKFAAIRNPVGIIYSSCFSLNALTSEYIQKYLPEKTNDEDLRQLLAKYKLTDLAFFEGLIKFQKNYWAEFKEVSEGFDHIMRWEDLLTQPELTIKAIGRACGMDVSDKLASSIWSRLAYKNLTGFHKHNYRQGSGKVEGWKNWLTNEHVDLIKASGVMDGMEKFGYEIEYLKDSEYTPFQHEVTKALKNHSIINQVEDLDLFEYAFNKSNLVYEGFAFHGYDWKKYSCIERSNFRDHDLEMKVSVAVESAMSKLNEIFQVIIDTKMESKSEILNFIEYYFKRLIFKVEMLQDDVDQARLIERLKTEILVNG